MNQERIHERQGEHNHAGQHSHQMRLDASQAQMQGYLIEGNLPDLFEEPVFRPDRVTEPMPRSAVVFEIGRRAMRRITRDGKR